MTRLCAPALHRPLRRILNLLAALSAVVALSDRPASASSASGATWVPIGPYGGVLFSLALDPRQPETLMAGGEAGVFRTVDGGTSWSLTPDSALGIPYQILFDPTDASRVYLGTSAGVFRSEDRGDTWVAASSGLPLNAAVVVEALAIQPTVSRTLYAAVGSRLFKTVNHGRSWFAVSAGLPKRAFISTIAVDPSSPATLYIGTTLGVFRSANGGVTWSPARSGMGLANVLALTIDPAGRGRIYAAVQPNDQTDVGGVFVSRNGGATWTATGPLPGPAGGTFCVTVTPSRVLYACANNGVARSVDGGQHWAAVNTGLETDGNLVAFRAIASDPTNPDHLYTATNDIENGSAAVFETDSGGEQWHPATNGINAQEVLALATDPAHSDVIYAAAASSIYATSDGGAHWTQGTGVSGVVTSIVVTPAAALASTDQGIFATTDDGLSWTQRSATPPGPLLADRLAPSQLFAFGVESSLPPPLGLDFLSSPDGGTTWTPLGPVPGVFVTAAVLTDSSPRTIYAAVVISTPLFSHTTALNISRDGGKTFTAISPNFSGINTLTADPADPSTAYFIANEQVAEGGSPPVFQTVPTLFKSTNFGAAIVPVERFAVAAIVDPTVPGKLYVATTTGLEVSTDAGATWTVVADTVPALGITKLALGADGTVYAGADAASLYKLVPSLP